MCMSDLKHDPHGLGLGLIVTTTIGPKPLISHHSPITRQFAAQSGTFDLLTLERCSLASGPCAHPHASGPGLRPSNKPDLSCLLGWPGRAWGGATPAQWTRGGRGARPASAIRAARRTGRGSNGPCAQPGGARISAPPHRAPPQLTSMLVNRRPGAPRLPVEGASGFQCIIGASLES